jgi:hypothetical protein
MSKLCHSVIFRMSEVEYLRVKQASDAAGMGVSEFCRASVAEKFETLGRVELLESALMVYKMLFSKEEVQRRVDLFNGPLPQTTTEVPQAHAGSNARRNEVSAAAKGEEDAE